jgi:hypothetical protein
MQYALPAATTLNVLVDVMEYLVDVAPTSLIIESASRSPRGMPAPALAYCCSLQYTYQVSSWKFTRIAGTNHFTACLRYEIALVCVCAHSVARTAICCKSPW